MTSMDLDDAMNTCSVYFTEEKEESYEATATHSHWVDYTYQNGASSENFSQYTEGNQVEAFLGGKAYFSALLDAFKSAQKTIYITGWQVNWDAQLATGIRLVDALFNEVCTKKDLKVYIMPWNCRSPVQTYAKTTERVFAALNTFLGREAFYVRLAGDQSGIFFSHHQKCVVVDEKIAFVGGIDLAYGRYDENTGQEGYSLVADAEGRKGMNRYNSCVYHTEPVPEPGTLVTTDTIGYDPMDESVHSPYPPKREDRPWEEEQKAEQNRKQEHEAAKRIALAVLKPQYYQRPDAEEDKYKYKDKDKDKDKDKSVNDHGYKSPYHWLNASVQPRMPWQDYQVRLCGPVVDDLIRNFVRRWNSYQLEDHDTELQTSKPHLVAPEGYPSAQCANGCQVQMLRSASLKMRNAEGIGEPKMKQDDIYRSVHQLISKAEHYIYIENQFFISAFGKPSIPDSAPLSEVAGSLSGQIAAVATKAVPGNSNAEPENEIAEWLGERISQTIYAKNTQPFHVCIVLPVHPEGKLDEASIVAQIHQTRQTLVSGSRSLLNRVRQALWVKGWLEKNNISRAKWCSEIPAKETECEKNRWYEEISYEACAKYVTLLNLRAWSEVGGVPVTEQIYVHSKLMIVDDRYVLVGSANINERSQLGDRDSELAVMIADTEGGYQDIDGSGELTPYRKFACDLRKSVWAKLLGHAAGDFPEFLAMPAKPEGWQKIRELAMKNAGIYEDAFDFIPRNYLNKVDINDQYEDNAEEDPSSLWPVFKSNKFDPKEAAKEMPFSANFWETYKEKSKNKSDKLKEIKGYITLLPIHWTEDENNLVDYHVELID
ncbi:phospholipase D-like domain-containing protein [Salmonella enterica]|uniref:phospholipase D-like domain-containing protein n=1 Tax=Salmonella enterica TaxID=28901 RepID=UPI0009ADCEA8|nr:phospholipase D-like domain-containing protein [Salmonella enterica]